MEWYAVVIMLEFFAATCALCIVADLKDSADEIHGRESNVEPIRFRKAA